MGLTSSLKDGGLLGQEMKDPPHLRRRESNPGRIGGRPLRYQSANWAATIYYNDVYTYHHTFYYDTLWVREPEFLGRIKFLFHKHLSL